MTNESLPAVSFQGVTRRYGLVTAVSGVNLDIAKGEFFALLGSSGSGKTTLLMLLAGFDQPTEGRVMISGTSVSDVPPHRRSIGVVFQNYALFPHMTAAENVAYPLKMRGVGRSEREERVNAALSLVNLTDRGASYPIQMSGGQQQRVALARSLVFGPDILLMDEPLGALDRRLRDRSGLAAGAGRGRPRRRRKRPWLPTPGPSYRRRLSCLPSRRRRSRLWRRLGGRRSQRSSHRPRPLFLPMRGVTPSHRKPSRISPIPSNAAIASNGTISAARKAAATTCRSACARR